MDDFLSAVDRIISLEHAIDDVHRLAKTTALSLTKDDRHFSLYTNIAANLEAASDSMMRAVLSLRDYTLVEVITR